ncbi:hypothetical protein [Treponema sp.]|uniref:hypothetical protein n=1 Tax=Treponema sp. TaxID=166 RepID=UPI0025DB9D1E|nr:hypothetical protein [Treponema sp.]MCR5217062.1 hypothetical protein [Treponema sp.]
MKRKSNFLFFSLSLLGICTIIGCSSPDSDNNSNSNNSDDLFASPKTVIENLDTELTFTNSTRSARTVVSEIYNQKNPDSAASRLSGELSTTQCILKMTKAEIAQAIGDLKFNTKFEPGNENPVVGSYVVEKEPAISISLSHFEVKHEDDSDTAYIYSRVIVDHPQAGNLQFDSVLKCTKNSKGTLDTELLMVGGDEKAYTKFTCTASEKKKTELKTFMDGSLKTWDDISITTNGIKGYKYNNENFEGTSKSKDKKGSFYVSNNGYSVTFYDENLKESDGRGQTTFICEKETGSVIMQKYSISGSTEETWSYNVNWIEGIDNWVIVDSEGDSAELKETESSPIKYNINKYHESYYNQDIYMITENNLGTLECKVSSSILDQMKNAINDFSYPTETPLTYITTEDFSTALTSMLDEWCGTLN